MRLLIAIVAVILANILFSNFFHRFDLTKEKRFSVSKATKNLLEDLNDVVYVEIFLSGELPADYRRFQNALIDLLNEYRAYSGRKIEYTFTDPFEGRESADETNKFVVSLMEHGLEVRQIAQQSLQETTRKFIIPGAMVRYQGRDVAVNFLPEQNMNEPTDEVISNGISTLEYNLSNAIRKLQKVENEKIGFLLGHGEAESIFLADIAGTLKQQQFDVERVDISRQIGISPTFSVLVIAKPTQEFSEQDKFKIDQFIMQGGKILWLIDGLKAEMDSLFKQTETAAFLTEDYQLNLDDMLLQYGARVNDDLVQDLQSAKIPLFAANSRQPVYYSWPYFPIIFPEVNHPIVKHLDPILFNFASSVDTTGAPGIKKTILLTSSTNSRTLLNPVRVSLLQATQEPMPEQYNKSNIPVAVLLEGEFTSIFKFRPPTEDFLRIYQDSLQRQFRDKSSATKMIVVGDGDIIKNEIGRNGVPSKLGYYRYNPNYVYANKNFILNSIDYLVDNYGLIATRTKDFKTRPLNTDELKENVLKWQMINLIVPIILILIFALIYNLVRKRKYAR